MIELKNQIDNIIQLNNVSDIIRKIKLIKIVLDNLISENAKSLKDIQNGIKNNNTIKTKNNDYNYEIIGEYNLESDEQKTLKYYIEKSLKQYSDYMDISKCIYNYCDKMKNGKWSIITGERDKYKLFSYFDQLIGVNIGPYKISIIYNS